MDGVEPPSTVQTSTRQAAGSASVGLATSWGGAFIQRNDLPVFPDMTFQCQDERCAGGGLRDQQVVRGRRFQSQDMDAGAGQFGGVRRGGGGRQCIR